VVVAFQLDANFLIHWVLGGADCPS
jgi:hypothetical protein